jgi:hypothetical protein
MVHLHLLKKTVYLIASVSLQHGMCVICNLVPLWFATWHVSLQKTMVVFVLQHEMCVIATWFLCGLQHGMTCHVAFAKKESMSNCICQFAKTMVVFVCNVRPYGDCDLFGSVVATWTNYGVLATSS